MLSYLGEVVGTILRNKEKERSTSYIVELAVAGTGVIETTLIGVLCLP